MMKTLIKYLSVSLLSFLLLFSFSPLIAKGNHGGGHHSGRHGGGHGHGGHGGHHRGGHRGHHGHHGHHNNYYRGGYYSGYGGWGGSNNWYGGTGFYLGVPFLGATLGATYYNDSPSYYGYYYDPYAPSYYGTTTYYY